LISLGIASDDKERASVEPALPRESLSRGAAHPRDVSR
jgi:hypothetical protein